MPDRAPVVTRFAPSPTGFLHIGGARTALFNWLLAKRLGGRMLLRIEDTDRARSTPEAVAAILEGLTWLGLAWDGDVVHQFARIARHREVAEAMVASGRAYPCYASAEELSAMREASKAAGRAPRYDGRWRDRSPGDAPPGVAPTIRLRAPTEGDTVIEDLVQGRVTFANRELDDLVLLRSDGTPTYMLAVVVDDHDMAVTHVVRGDDHLTNAARQVGIFRAMDWTVPAFAHIPLIHGPDGAKLSKRHGALGIEAYRAMGYLPAALRNYLVRLGWSHGDQEVFSTQDLVRLFDLKQVGRSAARFDTAKLDHLNGQYLRATDDDTLLDAVRDVLTNRKGSDALINRLDDGGWPLLRAAMPGLKERARTLVEIINGADFLFAARPLTLDERARGLLDGDGRANLAAARKGLSEVAEWAVGTTEAAVRESAAALGLKLGQMAQPLRAALTGRATSPGVFDVLAVLGREESLARIDDQLATAAADTA